MHVSLVTRGLGPSEILPAFCPTIPASFNLLVPSVHQQGRHSRQSCQEGNQGRLAHQLLLTPHPESSVRSRQQRAGGSSSLVTIFQSLQASGNPSQLKSQTFSCTFLLLQLGMYGLSVQLFSCSMPSMWSW